MCSSRHRLILYYFPVAFSLEPDLNLAKKPVASAIENMLEPELEKVIIQSVRLYLRLQQF